MESHGKLRSTLLRRKERTLFAYEVPRLRLLLFVECSESRDVTKSRSSFLRQMSLNFGFQNSCRIVTFTKLVLVVLTATGLSLDEPNSGGL
jgi:hypothetical protein